MRRVGRSHQGTRLFVVFAVASLLPVLVLGVVLTRGYRDSGTRQALEQGRAQAEVIEQMAIAPALGSADLSKGLTRGERRRLQSATDLAIFDGSVSRLRLLSFSGTVAFSDDGSVLGAVRRSDPAFQAAVTGSVEADVAATDDVEGAATIRVLQPVVPKASGQAIGVLEVFLPYETIAKRAEADTRAAIVRLAWGLLGLYAVLALISFWTTRALRRFAAHNEHQALHDPLTGLANRELFRQVAEQALARARSGSGGGALVLVDLDHFKEVNDSLGHHAGDELLTTVAQRLTESLRTDDTVARLGGDEFGLILPGGNRVETVELLTRVRREVGEPVTLDDARVSVGASFGVCFYPEDADDVEALLQHADAAMYQGKHGPLGVVVYEPECGRTPVDALVLQGELRQAIDHDQLVLHYQPKFDLATGLLTGVEALVRWQHPERGLLHPGHFLPVVERGELIAPMTQWVLRRALADLGDWTRAGFGWDVSVNVSARNLSSPEFARDVVRLLQEAKVPADRLTLEITETAIAFDHATAERVVAALAENRIAVAIDDFGVGYTALSQLRALPVGELKIDRFFVTGLADTPEDRAIVASLIDLAHGLGCTVTAEGVESQEVAGWLSRAGCDHAQGFVWMRPAPWTDVAAFARSPRSLPTHDPSSARGADRGASL